MKELFVDPNPDRIVGWVPSTNGILHAITAEKYYICNRAVGKHDDVFSFDPEDWDNPQCKNCLRKLK